MSNMKKVVKTHKDMRTALQMANIRVRAAQAVGLRPGELCIVCLNVIHVMCFKGTNLCSELCRKNLVGEESKEMAVANK